MATEPTTTRDSGWSPFARPLEPHCEAVADALLNVVEGTNGVLDELDQASYAEYRDANPQLGLPRATTVAGACGSWEAAIEHATVKAARRHRQSFAA